MIWLGRYRWISTLRSVDWLGESRDSPVWRNGSRALNLGVVDTARWWRSWLADDPAGLLILFAQERPLRFGWRGFVRSQMVISHVFRFFLGLAGGVSSSPPRMRYLTLSLMWLEIARD